MGSFASTCYFYETHRVQKSGGRLDRLHATQLKDIMQQVSWYIYVCIQAVHIIIIIPPRSFLSPPPRDGHSHTGSTLRP